MKYLLAFILLIFSLACFAAVYMQTDSSGNVVYSDTPDDHAKPISLPNSNNISLPQNTVSTAPQINNSSLPATPSPEPGAGQQQMISKNYTTFMIVDPVDQQTFQNQHEIHVTMRIEPSLQEGDRVQLYVDGVPAGSATNDPQQLVLHEVERGEHQLSATLLDQADHVLEKTNNITIYVHYSALVTGSGGIAPIPSAGGAAPSSPGSGIVPAGSGITPSGSGVVPSGSGTVPAGSGVMPPARAGSGIVPP